MTPRIPVTSLNPGKSEEFRSFDELTVADFGQGWWISSKKDACDKILALRRKVAMKNILLNSSANISLDVVGVEFPKAGFSYKTSSLLPPEDGLFRPSILKS